MTNGALPQVLHGLANLSKDGIGNVYWKGSLVERYSFSDEIKEKEAATRLAVRCALLESKGFPVTSRTVLWKMFLEAPVNTPWIELMQRIYAIVFVGQLPCWLILTTSQHGAVAIGKEPNGELKRSFYDQFAEETGCDRAYRALKKLGGVIVSPLGMSYERLLVRLNEMGITPEDVAQQCVAREGES